MASLYDLLLGQGNPLAQKLNSNSNTFLGLGASLLGGGPRLDFTPLQQGRLADTELARQERADAKTLAAENQTMSWVKAKYPEYANLPMEQAYQLAMKAEAERLQAANSGSGGIQTGYTPIWGTMGDKPAIALPGNDGRLYVDGKAIDPTTFTPTNPYDLNAQKAGGAAFGNATGGAQFSVPNAGLELDQSLAATGKLNDPDIQAGMRNWFEQWGALPRGMWVQGGTNMAKFKNAATNVIDRSWLSARAALKGGGQITDYEGAKAENAVSMMKAALDSGDQASYEAAVQDYEYWIKQGFAKLQQQAGTMQGYGTTAPQQNGPGNGNAGSGWTVLGVE